MSQDLSDFTALFYEIHDSSFRFYSRDHLLIGVGSIRSELGSFRNNRLRRDRILSLNSVLLKLPSSLPIPRTPKNKKAAAPERTAAFDLGV